MTLSLAFASGTDTYTASVANSVDEVTVTATENHASATVEILDTDNLALTDADSTEDGFQVALSVGSTQLGVLVTAEDGTTTKFYTVNVTRDDFPNDNTTTGKVDVGGSVTGNIGTVADYDRFKVELEAGTRYQLDLEGADTGRDTLADPHLGLYDAIGSQLQGDNGQQGDDNSGVGVNARMIYTPDASGDFYPVVTEIDDALTGTYTLSVIVLGANGVSEADTDFPYNNTTSGRVEVGASVTGNTVTGDTDWFRVDLEAGKTYQIDLEGADGGRGTLADPLLSFFDTSGSLITTNDDKPANLDSQLVETATATGTWYLGAGGSVNETGTYTLSVRDITPPPPCTLNTGDIWCGVVTVAEIKTSPGDALVGHGFADGAGLSAGSLAGNPDDTMFSVGDNDYTIWAAYIQVPTADHLTGTLFVLFSAYLTDDDLAGLVLTDDDTTTTFEFNDATEGTTGLYSWGQSGLDWSSATTVTVRLSGPPPDDFPAGTNTTGQVDVGGSVTGNIESAADADWFLVELEAGTRYQIDLEGADTGRGTLVDPAITFLLTAIGDTISESGGSDSGVGKNDRTIYTPSMSGTYYVDVSSGTTATGTYTLSVIVLGANGASEADNDCPNHGSTTCRVDVGASATGNIGASSDSDWFRVELEADKTYQIDMEGGDTNGGTLVNPELLDITDSEGDTIADTGNDDIDGDNFNSQITFTPTEAGRYYLVAASGVTGGTGTYTLSVRDITSVTLSIADAEATEGDDVEFTATLSAADAAVVTATWTATIGSGDTAVAADLGTTKTGTVTVTAGQLTGTFTVTLSGVSSNATLGTATATGTINNDDAPAAPTNFAAAVGNAQVVLSWDAPDSGSGVTRHEYRQKEGTGSYPANFTPIPNSGEGGTNEAGFTVTGLTNETAYTFELRAVAGAINGAAADSDAVTPTPGICGRTAKIQEVILAELADVSECAAVTVADLASITTFGGGPSASPRSTRGSPRSRRAISRG